MVCLDANGIAAAVAATPVIKIDTNRRTGTTSKAVTASTKVLSLSTDVMPRQIEFGRENELNKCESRKGLVRTFLENINCS